jgi:hypothetical protein
MWFFGAFGGVARCSGRLLERQSARDALAGRGCSVRDATRRELGPPTAARRPVVIIAAS